jgi:hypothetical protein
MINRYQQSLLRATVLAPSVRPPASDAFTTGKSRADIRREILTKLSVRMQNLGISNF